MSKRMTAAFELDVRTLGVNPFKVETPFGPPVTVSDGDEFERADALEARIAELEEALRFYEDEWETDFSSARRVLACFAPVNPSDNLLADRGVIARTALKETDR